MCFVMIYIKLLQYMIICDSLRKQLEKKIKNVFCNGFTQPLHLTC